MILFAEDTIWFVILCLRDPYKDDKNDGFCEI